MAKILTYSSFYHLIQESVDCKHHFDTWTKISFSCPLSESSTRGVQG